MGARHHCGLLYPRRCAVSQAVGTYADNPLVVDNGLSVADAKSIDGYGKGGGLVDGKLVREFPSRESTPGREALEARPGQAAYSEGHRIADKD